MTQQEFIRVVARKETQPPFISEPNPLQRAFDEAGVRLSSVQLVGPNGYDLTAAFLAWGAERAANGQLHGKGALGPVEAFGLDELTAAAAEYGLVEA